MTAPPFVIYGSTPWDDPWLTEQNLAHALSRDHLVLYVEPPLTPLTPLRYGVRRETASQAARLLRRGTRTVGRMHVLSPIVFPPRSSRRARAVSAPLLARQIRVAVKRLGIEEPVAVTAQWAPGIVGAAGERQLVCLVKDWIEAGAGLLGRNPSDLAKDRDTLIGAADVVCTISRQLQRTLGARGVETTLLRHGFHAELASCYDRAAPPDEYSALPRPLLGYAGRIDDRLDFDILEALAERFANGSLVLVGPTSPLLPSDRLARLRSHPNIHLLGARPRERLPGYLVHLDCCLMPYRQSEWSRHGSPLKLWDYLYAGPPSVGSGYVALKEFPPPLVHFVEEPGGFSEAVAIALRRDGDADASRRREVALANSWHHRAAQLRDLVMSSDRIMR